jgi:DNA-directed RNA polymerase III subunit RPC2
LEYIAGKLKSSKIPPKAGRSKADEVRDILADIILAHVPMGDGYDFSAKCRYLSWMIRRVIDAYYDPKKLSDRDYYGNKRLELAGQLVSLMFEDLFKRLNSEIKDKADKEFKKAHGSKTKPMDASKLIHKDVITQGFTQAISTGNWTLKRFKMERAGVTEVLSRLSYTAALGMMTRISS